MDAPCLRPSERELASESMDFVTTHKDGLWLAMVPGDIMDLVRQRVFCPRWMAITRDYKDNNPVYQFDLGGTTQQWRECSCLEFGKGGGCLTTVRGVPVLERADGRGGLHIHTYNERTSKFEALCEAPAPGGMRDVAGVGDFLCTLSCHRAGIDLWMYREQRWIKCSSPPCAGLSMEACTGGERLVLYTVPDYVEDDSDVDLSQVHLFDPGADRWTKLPTPPVIQRHASLQTTPDEKMIYMVGGMDAGLDQSIDRVERLDFRCPAWHTTAALPHANYSNEVCFYDDNQFAVLETTDPYCAERKRAWRYDARADAWANEPRWALPAVTRSAVVVRF